ncbi:MAG TPA: hypothetical protein VM243_17380 [Phycisphaerae bacterium]|nr:hypothetical protein [Phycisphaerae bacterium]
MPQREYNPVDLSALRTYSVADRAHKVSLSQMAALPPAGASAAELLASMPNVLGAREFHAVARAIVRAHRGGRPVVFAMGAHVVKVGCGPIVIDLIERGIVTAVVCNGATAIHDVEMAVLGATSEEVAETIRDGSFGMVSETMDFFTAATDLASREGVGLGQSVGRLLIQRNAPNLDCSILAAAVRAGVPACVHVAVGTDTVHMAPAADGAKIGAATLQDFRLACSVVADLGADKPDGPGGVWLNVGSAVVLPEVFLKAVSVARNLGADLDAMTTANFDMLGHYRPRVNVVRRPTASGRGHEVIGHHEILLPLLRQAVIEELAGRGDGP